MEMSSLKARLIGMLLSLAMAVLLLAGVLYLASRAGEAVKTVQAAPVAPSLADKVIVVNLTGTINIIDTATDIVYGPYLSGTLGSPGGTFDVAVTPNGKTALISNFGLAAVYFVDVSDPFSPTFIVSTTLPLFAEDIAITANGRYALVTDGGLTPSINTLDLISHTLIYTADLGTHFANTVAVAPNGTVVVADYYLGDISSLKLEDTGELTYMDSYSYTINSDGVVTPSLGLPAQPIGVQDRTGGASVELPVGVSVVPTSTLISPVNIAIAPDGKTVLVCNHYPYWSDETSALFHIGVYQVTEPGVLTFSSAITGLSRAAQSVVFSPDGRYAYLSANGTVNETDPNDNFDRLLVLEILAPGEVQLVDNNAAELPRQTSGQLFGVDTITLANRKFYLGYPTSFADDNMVQVISLDDFSVSSLEMSGLPLGVSVIPVQRQYLPMLRK